MPTLLLVMLSANVMSFNGNDVREEIVIEKRHVLEGEDNGFIYQLSTGLGYS
jgi:hypothetical protein